MECLIIHSTFMHGLVACCAFNLYHRIRHGRVAAHMLQVLAEAHAVVLASGTLSPIASLSQQLFPGLAPDRLSHFSCGHVVGKERLLALVVGQVGQHAGAQARLRASC